uniref:MCM DNA helicase complex subunit n=1 Tax=Sphaerodactylus townsendi TaxID=933632 RepID=A0ACB8GEU1_9SAUR
MAAPVDDTELRSPADYLDFLDEDQGIYQSKVRTMISDNQYRLIVNINDLRRKNEKRARRYVLNSYDQYKTPMENIGLQDSLLSRFDLLFIVLDQMDPEQDREISDHVLRMHRYRAAGEQDGDVMPLGSSVERLATEDPSLAEEEEQEVQIYEKHDDLLHGPKRRKEKIVSVEFMRKYINFAKMLKPVLTEEAAAFIAKSYSELRSQEEVNSDVARTCPITARTLETLIRLSTAHAKARMCKSIDEVDAKAALDLVQFAYFKKVLEKEKKRKKQSRDEAEQETDEEEERETERKQKKRRKATGGERPDPYDFSDTEEEMPEVQARTPKSPDPPGTGETKTKLAESRLKEFKAALLEVFRSTHAQSVGLENVMKSINQDRPTPFLSSEVKAALEQMQDDNQIMMSDDIIFLI